MPDGSALNDILQMRQQGLSNNQIVQNLQRQGYTNTQIFDSMNQADTKVAVEGTQQPLQTAQPVQNVPDQLFTQPPREFASSEPLQQEFAPQADQVQIEELVEAIIEEKWNDLIRDVNKIVEWKNKVESRISDMEVKLNSLKDSFTDLNQAILGKVNDYDKHIMEVGSNIKAMEKVFAKILPTFTENVNQLSRITSQFKGKKESLGELK